MRILITGSSGFIGAHLARELRSAGHTVLDMDIAEGPGNDASDPRAIRVALDSSHAEVVVHLAARGSHLGNEDEVIQTVRDNAGMAAVVAQAAGEFGIRMVCGSSAAVYGDNGTRVCHEINGPWETPSSIFGLSKLWSEQACALYVSNFAALRFSAPYGPGSRNSALVNMLWQAENRETIPVHIGADRSWCWIGDVVRACRLVIEHGEGPYNIGRDDDSVSMERVAQLACVITGADAELITMVPTSSRQILSQRVDTERLRRLSFVPQMSLYDGMVDTYENWVKGLNSKAEQSATETEVVDEPVTTG